MHNGKLDTNSQSLTQGGVRIAHNPQVWTQYGVLRSVNIRETSHHFLSFTSPMRVQRGVSGSEYSTLQWKFFCRIFFQEKPPAPFPFLSSYVIRKNEGKTITIIRFTAKPPTSDCSKIEKRGCQVLEVGTSVATSRLLEAFPI